MNKLKSLWQHKRAFEPYRIERCSRGTTYQFWIGDAEGQDWYAPKNEGLGQVADDESVEMIFVLDRMIAAGDVVFECGAHHGWTTIQLAKGLEQAGDGRLVAFEPNLNNFDILMKNVADNGCNNVTLEAAVVGAEPGVVKFYQKSNGSVMPPLLSRALFSRRMLNVLYGFAWTPVVTIDEYAAAHNLWPTFLKIDVEGFECDVLAGATAVLATAPKLFIEIHTMQLPLYGGTVERLYAQLALERYQVWIQFSDDEQPQEVDPGNMPQLTDRAHLYALPLTRQ
jgi:FkbM family methyltransferase